MRRAYTTLLAVAVILSGLAGCDFSEQNVDWEPGDSLIIVGPVDESGGGGLIEGATDTGVPILYQPVEAYFYVSGFTIEADYEWFVNDTPAGELESAAVLNEGEFLRVQLTDPGDYTIEVLKGDLSGTADVVVQNPPE